MFFHGKFAHSTVSFEVEARLRPSMFVHKVEAQASNKSVRNGPAQLGCPAWAIHIPHSFHMARSRDCETLMKRLCDSRAESRSLPSGIVKTFKGIVLMIEARKAHGLL